MRPPGDGVEQPQPASDSAEPGSPTQLKRVKLEPLDNIWRSSAQITTPLFLQIDSRALKLRKQLCFRLKPLGEYSVVLDTVEELVQRFISEHREHCRDFDEDLAANELASVRDKVVESFEEWQALVEDWKTAAIRRIGVLTQEMAHTKDQLFQSEALVTGLKTNLEQKEEALSDLRKRLDQSTQRCLRLSRKRRKLKEEGKLQAKVKLVRGNTDESLAAPQLSRQSSRVSDAKGLATSQSMGPKVSMEKLSEAKEILWCKTQSETISGPFRFLPRRGSDSRLYADHHMKISEDSAMRRSDLIHRSSCSGDSTSSMVGRLQTTMETFGAKLARGMSRNNSRNGQVRPELSEKEIDSSSTESEDSSNDALTSGVSVSSYTTSTNLTKAARLEAGRCALLDVEVQTMLSLDSNAPLEPQQLSTVSLECLRTLARELTLQSTEHVTQTTDQVGMVSLMLNELETLISAVLSWLLRLCTQDAEARKKSLRRPSTGVEAQRLLIQLQSMMERCAGFKIPHTATLELSVSTTDHSKTLISNSSSSSGRDQVEGSKVAAHSEDTPELQVSRLQGSELPSNGDSDLQVARQDEPRRGLLTFFQMAKASRSKAPSSGAPPGEAPCHGRLRAGSFFRWRSCRGQEALNQLVPAESNRVHGLESSCASNRSPTVTGKRTKLFGAWTSKEAHG